MIKLLIGQKGTGKSKAMIEMANNSAQKRNGDVIFIDGDSRYTMTLDRSIRFIDISEFGIKDINVFYGFLSGIVAQNYDIDFIYVDGFLEMKDEEQMQDIEAFLLNIEKLSKKFHVKITLSISGDPMNVPVSFEKYMIDF
ncbi:MAG: ATP-binding protein [Xylanivirga thermophila]|uniref:ATP-binding protein n=1 Tax=Xylanivirga thermophila TaxID=2496273 RepID=UPI00101D35DA|nr:ATP-binding protein [Xylanivirga thermophila]